jgi:hypothetical protein
MLFAHSRSDLTKLLVIWLVVKLDAFRELIDRQWCAQQWRSVGSGPPDDTTGGDVPRLRVPRYRRGIDFIRAPVQVDDVS